ncbi:hypothetical protein ZHAS_00021790 [Anopheles sinensis]|uniref:Uncharacterized protein n=1 Tax=Anopheles sinensis TaxID=74873 RepID=A0A084WTL3_ANOSI|nr:hypothetical protein ZHAS_00021790 [Anopheles sinensis]
MAQLPETVIERDRVRKAQKPSCEQRRNPSPSSSTSSCREGIIVEALSLKRCGLLLIGSFPNACVPKMET